MFRDSRKMRRNFITASAPKRVNAVGRCDFTGEVDIVAAAGEGKRPTFTISAYNGDPMRVGFSYYPVMIDLAGLRAASQNIPILANHDECQPVGQSTEVRISARSVSLTGSLTGEDDVTKNIMAHARNGYKWQASVGVSVVRSEFLEAGSTATVNGKKVKGPLLIARESVLVETSIVTIGADGSSSVKIAASQGSVMKKFHEWLKARGVTVEQFQSFAAEAQSALQAAYDSIQESATDPENPVIGKVTAAGAEPNLTAKNVAEIVAAALAASDAEHARRAEINRILAGHSELLVKAHAEKWSVDKAELEVLKASRPVGPGGIVRGSSSGQVDGDVLRCALHQSTGLVKTTEKEFKPEVLQAAHDRFKHRISLQQLLLQAAWNSGQYQGSHFDSSPSGLREILKAAFSTVSLPGILSNVQNKFLLQGFMGVDQSWRAIAKTKPVKDFKQITSYRMTGDLEFVEVGASGEIEHGTLGEEDFSNQARTYGKMLAITRRDLINDDLSALSDVPQRLGRGAGLGFNTIFWDKFLDHAAFFPTDDSNDNYISGSTTPLSSAGLTLAQTKLRRQTDPDGKPLALMPAWLLVPPELEVTAQELLRATTINTGGASTVAVVPNVNVFSGRFPPVVSPYLTSALEWYLGVSLADLAMIEAVFLNGQEQPTVESAEVDFNTLGIQSRGYFDFGAELQEHRAAVKSKGAA